MALLIEERQKRSLGDLIRAPIAAIWLAVIMLAGISILGALMIWQSYNAAIELSEARAKSSAQVVAAHMEWLMEASDQALRRIDAVIGPGPIRASPGTIANLRDAVSDLPDGFQYSVYDETGQLRMSSMAEAIGIDVSDREYFQHLRDGAAFFISAQLEERLSGEQVFVVARRISRDGEFHGAASIAIPTRTMGEYWATMDLGPDSSIAIVRPDGWIVARYPQLPQAINLGTSRLFTELVGGDAGFYHSTSSATDGIPRVVGFRKVASWPLITTTGIAKSEALRFFWSSLRIGLAVGLPMLGLLVLGVGWIIHLLRADAARSKQLVQALEHNEFLLREIHHRVKNNLQAVSSLIRLQPMPKDSKDDLARRIGAMVAVHEQIYGNDQFDRLDLARYLERLVNEVAAGFPGAVDVATSFEPISISRDRALPVGLFLNEVVSNAFKHAFRERETGRLEVKLTSEGDGAKLTVVDDGDGYDTSGDRKGMGRRLIDGFVAQLDGSLEVVADGGTRVVLTFPTD